MATAKAAPGPEIKSPAPKKDAGAAVPGKLKTDWDAVERDFRTGKFTLRELGNKYGVSHAAVGKKARDNQWQQDLTEQIRQATNAKLTAELVSNEVDKGFHAVSETVQAMAEVNAIVIRGHRKDAAATRNVAAALLDELASQAMLVEHQELLAAILAGSGAEPKDEARARAVVYKALDVGSRISSIKALSETFTKVQAMERTAFKLDNEPTKPPESQEDRASEIDSRFSAFSARLDQIARTGNAPA